MQVQPHTESGHHGRRWTQLRLRRVVEPLEETRHPAAEQRIEKGLALLGCGARDQLLHEAFDVVRPAHDDQSITHKCAGSSTAARLLSSLSS